MTIIRIVKGQSPRQCSLL